MQTGAISFLDILGFKGIWQNYDSEEVLKILYGVDAQVQTSYKQPSEEKKWPKSELPEITVLSDTIVVVIKSDEPHCLFLLANIIFDLFLYFWKFDLFLRGAVSFGEYSQKGATFIGPAIDDVASWYEEVNWIGAVLTPKTNYLVDRFSRMIMAVNGFQVEPYIKYPVPGKGGKTHNLYSLNWPSYLQSSYKQIPVKPDGNTSKELMYKMFSKQPAFNGVVLSKYENTLHFLDYAIANFISVNC
jgi:hypothetical protein